MSRFLSRSRARVAAVALGVGVLGSLATAPASFAAGAKPQPPAIGANCQTDGKINGAGSTFQTLGVQDAFVYGFQQDVCGPQPVSTNLNAAYSGADPSVYSFGTGPTSVSGMVAYNVSLAGTAETNGSGAGLNRMSCRTDFFSGTDLPYNNTQQTNLQGAPGANITAPATCNSSINTGAVPPPFGPQSSVGYPNSNDAAAKFMSFPSAAGAVAVAVNLNGMCTSGTPTALDLTADEYDKIWQGEINQWDDNELVATNPILATDGCSGNITRVVRFDNSGTTAINMFTLYGIDPNALCAGALNWYQIGTASNNSGQWPTGAGCAEGVGTFSGGTVNNSPSHPNAVAPAAVTAGTNGSPALITKLDSTNGGIGYAETGLWPSPLPAGVSFASVQTFSDEQTSGNGLSNPNPGNDSSGNAPYILPGSTGQKSNCSLPAAVPTGSTALAAVGLGSTTWSNSLVGTTPGKQDIAWASEGAGYPVCGLTFDLVYSGIQNETGETAAPATSGVATAGCTIPAASNPSTTTSGVSVAGSLTVVSAAGFPATGTINVGGTNYAYTAVNYSTNTFTAASVPAGIASGTAASLFSTTVAATASTVGVNGGCQSVQGPLQGATNDQLRTLYSFWTYVFSPLGQSAVYLPTVTLDPLPASWLANLQTGFQQNF